MRALFIALTAALLLTNSAFAQSTDPIVYVCSPGGAIYKVQGTNSDKIYTATAPVDDCVVGPDGYLYVSNGSGVLRFDPATKNTAKDTDEFIAPGFPLGSNARGLAFNGFKLFVNTVSSGIAVFQGTSGTPLNIPNTAPATLVSGSGAGGGLVFDVAGKLVFTQAGSVRRRDPPAYSSATTIASTVNAAGLALNACREPVYSNPTTRKVFRIKSDGAIAEITLPITPTNPTGSLFADGESPGYIAIDTQNRLYAVTSTNKVFRYDPNEAVGTRSIEDLADADASCGTVKNKTQLLSQSGIGGGGIALGPNDVEITHTLQAVDCKSDFDFGYYIVKFIVDECGPGEAPFTLKMTSRLSRPADVAAALSTLDPNAAALRYSSLGGWSAEVLMNPVTSITPTFPRGAFQTQYWFFTQDTLVSLGLARGANEALSAPYTQNELDDYWGVTTNFIFDPMGCRDGCDFSKHVPYNSTPAQICTLANLQPPFVNTQTPAQANSTLGIRFTSCAGLTLRLSVARLSPDPALISPVEAAGNSSFDNFFTSSGSSYQFNLKTSGLPNGSYIVTINGDGFQSINLPFIISH